MKSARAQLVPNGGSQAVRLPEQCRFPAGQRKVVVRRKGRRVVLEAIDEWPDEFRAGLGAWQEPIRRPPARPLPRLANPFD